MTHISLQLTEAKPTKQTKCGTKTNCLSIQAGTENNIWHDKFKTFKRAKSLPQLNPGFTNTVWSNRILNDKVKHMKSNKNESHREKSLPILFSITNKLWSLYHRKVFKGKRISWVTTTALQVANPTVRLWINQFCPIVFVYMIIIKWITCTTTLDANSLVQITLPLVADIIQKHCIKPLYSHLSTSLPGKLLVQCTLVNQPFLFNSLGYHD